MAFPKPKQGGTDFEMAPADTHAARCYQVIDMGVQERPNSQYGPAHEIRIAWELTDCPMADGRNFAISRSFTYSLSAKANLRKILESWRGKAFDESELDAWTPDSLINAPCLLQVQHNTGTNGKTYAQVATVTKPPKGMTVPPLTNPTVIYSPEFHDPAAWALLTKWTQEKINNRVQAEGTAPESENPAPAGGGTFVDDDIPF